MLRACVIGWPIQHSRSPLIHGHWLAKYGIEGTYTREAVKPEDVTTFLASLADRGFAGCNVTLPHKHAALAAAAQKHAAAVAIGAANTLWLEDGDLHATNTDAYGFMTHLSETVPDWQSVDAPVSILGAGGAARALIHGFLTAGVEDDPVFRTRGQLHCVVANVRCRRLDDRHHFTLVLPRPERTCPRTRASTIPSYRILKHYTPGPFTFLLPATRDVPRRLMHPKRRTIGLSGGAGAERVVGFQRQRRRESWRLARPSSMM
ncbi:MAG: hypothetical protein HC869_07935 [Rhodospirillales bacterium]|nr:hypothetical protein [Rhodospirillales bacterium]